MMWFKIIQGFSESVCLLLRWGGHLFSGSVDFGLLDGLSMPCLSLPSPHPPLPGTIT